MRIDPHARPSSIEIGATLGTTVHRSFIFSGFHWTDSEIAERLLWVLVALCITAIAALFFDRFSKSARSAGLRRPNAVTQRWSAAIARYTTPVLDLLFGSDFGAIVLAELRLLIRGLSFWWFVVAAGFWCFQLLADAKAQSLAIGLAWIWPMLLWSQLGTREHLYDTEQLIYPTLHPIRRQFAAQWLAGIALAFLVAAGALIHYAATGNFVGIEGVAAGAVFVPTLALGCGALSGTTRLFEIVYLVLWYVGPMNRTTLDFTQGAYAPGFAIASLALFAIAVAARKLRLQYA